MNNEDWTLEHIFVSDGTVMPPIFNGTVPSDKESLFIPLHHFVVYYAKNPAY